MSCVPSQNLIMDERGAGSSGDAEARNLVESDTLPVSYLHALTLASFYVPY
jgi:hypothetical protein